MTEEEVLRVNRVRIAEKFGKLPHEIDAMPYTDYCDVLAVMQGDRDIEERRAHLKRGKKR